jgi:RimJ/RimL family protein N-acetyltransferase
VTYYKKLAGQKCYLSPCQLEDSEKWTAWFNDLEVSLPLGDEAYTPITYEQQRDSLLGARNGHVFSIVTQGTDELIGRCLLFAVNMVDRSAMAGIVIGEKSYWGKGYGFEAMALLLDYAFNLLNLNSVMLGTYDFNKRAIRCYEKLGFRTIGRRRQARIIGNRKFDTVLMDILAEEFDSVYVRKLVGG